MKSKAIICLTLVLTFLLLGCLQVNENAQKAVEEVNSAEQSFNNARDFFEQKRYAEADQELDNVILFLNSAESYLNKAERGGFDKQKVNEMKAVINTLKSLQKTFRGVNTLIPEIQELQNQLDKSETRWELEQIVNEMLDKITDFQEILKGTIADLGTFEQNYPEPAKEMNASLLKSYFELIDQNLEQIKERARTEIFQ